MPPVKQPMPSVTTNATADGKVTRKGGLAPTALVWDDQEVAPPNAEVEAQLQRQFWSRVPPPFYGVRVYVYTTDPLTWDDE